MLAIIEAYRAGLLKTGNWSSNIIAGLIVGVVALPLAMAFAIASGVKPEQGLYTAIVAALFVSIFGGSRVQIAGPTGAFIVILANITAQYGVSGLQIASLMSGFILLGMGAVKLGNVVKFIPAPVIVGFTSGIGFIIFIGEWNDFFGLSVHLPLEAHFYEKFWALIIALPNFDIATTGLASLGIFLLWIAPKFIKSVPSPLIAMVITTAVQAFFQFSSVATIGSTFGGIPQHLPAFQLPVFTLNHIFELIGPACTIALLSAIESLLSATAADSMANTRHNSNQELIGQGLANIITPFFGGFAATGAIARTATNIRSGGNSPIAAIAHCIFLVFFIMLLAPLANYIPLCSLAAILFGVAYNMSDISHFINMVKRAPRYDVIVLITTFLFTILTNLVVAVNIGIILAMLFFVRRMHQSTVIEERSHNDFKNELLANRISQLPTDTLIYTIQGPFFFGVAEKIEQVLASANSNPKIIIFCLKDVPFMDITGLETFNELIEYYYNRGVEIYLCEANPKVTRKLTNIGILPWITEKRIFEKFGETIQSIARLQI